MNGLRADEFWALRQHRCSSDLSGHDHERPTRRRRQYCCGDGGGFGVQPSRCLDCGCARSLHPRHRHWSHWCPRLQCDVWKDGRVEEREPPLTEVARRCMPFAQRSLSPRSQVPLRDGCLSDLLQGGFFPRGGPGRRCGPPACNVSFCESDDLDPGIAAMSLHWSLVRATCRRRTSANHARPHASERGGSPASLVFALTTTSSSSFAAEQVAHRGRSPFPLPHQIILSSLASKLQAAPVMQHAASCRKRHSADAARAVEN